MMIDAAGWKTLATYTKNKLVKMYDPGFLVQENSEFHEKCKFAHRGFFIGLVSSADEELLREGFLREGQTNLQDSCNLVVENVYQSLQSKNVPLSTVQTATFHFCAVLDVQYLPDPMQWDESKDGIYFQWGQDFRGFYLPYEISRMPIKKIEIMDRLCQKQAKTCSNLWKLPEGLCWKMVCHSFSF